MRDDVKTASRGRWFLAFFGANRERRKLGEYLHEGEVVHDILSCSYGTTGGRSLLVATNERVLVVKDGWIYKNSQSIDYSDIRSVEARTGVFFSKIVFDGEGSSIFEVTEAGRFATDHLVKLVRSRVGARYNSWLKEVAEQQGAAPMAPATAPMPSTFTSSPATPSQPYPAAALPPRPQRPTPTQATPVVPTHPELSQTVPDGLEFGDYLRIAQEQENAAQASSASPDVSSTAPQRDLFTELQALEDEYQAGLMSDGEFNLRKRNLLS